VEECKPLVMGAGLTYQHRFGDELAFQVAAAGSSLLGVLPFTGF